MRLRRPAGTEPQLGGSTPDQVVGGILALRDWYERRAVWHRRWFRLSGVAIIVLSATLPLLAGVDFAGKDPVIAVVGVLIAITAGLRGFYKWDEMWGVLRRSAFELAFLIEGWRLETAALTSQDPVDQAAVLERTRALLVAANSVRERESLAYFNSLQFPSGGLR